MSKYADISDDDFYKSVNKNFSQYKIPKKQPTLEEFCFPKKFSLQIPQQFLAEFINPKTPYKRILMYHEIGAGKTCAAINICEGFKGKMNIIVVVPASLKGNFRWGLRSECAGNNYLTQTERNKLAKLNPSSIEYQNIIDISDERIDSVYTIYSYNKFIELVKKERIDFDNTLLIIDEVHNMISDTGTYYRELERAINSAPDTLRMVIMTATPIFDKPEEIALTMNLLITDRDKLMPKGKQFINTFMDVKLTKKGYVYNVKNMKLFKSYVRGYVSYYRGAPSHVFPKTKFRVSKVKMSEKQRRIYNGIIKNEAKKTAVRDYVNVDISNNFFIGTRMASNIVFPNNKMGYEGFESFKPNIFSPKTIDEYSPKFHKIYKNIKKSKRTVFVYSNFKEYGGIKMFAEMLKYYGYVDYADEGAGLKRYAIWSGDQPFDLKEEIRQVFNDVTNTDGSKIKIILGSPSVKEGISFLRVEQVHLIEPYWNWSRMNQIIGRAIRFCSHKDLDIEDQLVNVWIYLAVHPKIKKSVDEHIMHMAITKKKINGEFDLAMKQAAVDCKLFKNGNVQPGDNDYSCDR